MRVPRSPPISPPNSRTPDADRQEHDVERGKQTEPREHFARTPCRREIGGADTGDRRRDERQTSIEDRFARSRRLGRPRRGSHCRESDDPSTNAATSKSGLATERSNSTTTSRSTAITRARSSTVTAKVLPR
jgi:hypothetical protein